ncbi:MAG: DeoR family transcriptional regulator, partial [Ktedonobacterales bacterium]
MPVNDGGRVSQRRIAMRDLLLSAPGRKWRTKEIADRFGVSPDTAFRDLSELSGTGQVPLLSTGETANFLWELDPDFDPRLPALRLDYAQGAAMYAAARLLSQQQNERNDAVRSALLALVQTLPGPLRPHLEATVLGFTPATTETRDLSQAFSVLSRGWLQGRIVQLAYEPLHSARLFHCVFRHYLMEPSGIGYT